MLHSISESTGCYDELKKKRKVGALHSFNLPGHDQVPFTPAETAFPDNGNLVGAPPEKC